MEEYKFYTTIGVIGDKSKYLFAKEYIDNSEKFNYTFEVMEKYNICILYDDKNHIETNENTITIYSKLFPKYKKIKIFKSDVELKKIEKILVFNSFPYIKKDLLEDIEFNLKNYNINQVNSVLYKEDRKFGKGDLSNEEDIIQKAIDVYKEKSIKTIVYKENKKNDDLFYINPNFINIFKLDYINKYSEVKEMFDLRYSIVYDSKIKRYFSNMFGILDIDGFETFNNIFSYNSIKNSNDIWNTFKNIFQKKYMRQENGILNKSKEVYGTFVESVCYWDFEKDKEGLEEIIIKRYLNYFGQQEKISAPKNEFEYINLLNNQKENALNIIFNNKLESFLDIELKNIIHDYINEKFDLIDQMIGG